MIQMHRIDVHFGNGRIDGPNKLATTTSVTRMPGRSAAHAFELWERRRPTDADAAVTVRVSVDPTAAVPVWAGALA